MEPQQPIDKKEKEIAESYLSSLIDLNVNSKPLINMLTMLAEENIEHGQTIVNAVEQRIAKVEPEFKLPILYLIDSIVKNVGREYVGLFSTSIVNIFCGAFEKVDERIRTKMFSLRQTWDDVFPPQKLFALDIKVNRIDPGWPVAKPKSSSIHVNPNFFQTKTENDLQAKLQIKQRELLELKKRKLELELAATQKQLGLTTVAIDPKSAVVNPMPDALTKPPASMMLTMNPRKQTLINPTHMNPVVITAAPVYDVARTQVPVVSTNVRQRIAPVDPALLSTIRPSRDPRLLRQTQNSSTQLPHGNAAQQSGQQQTATLANFNGPAQRIAGNFPNSNSNNAIHRGRVARYPPNEFNDKSVMNANSSSDSQSKEASKESKSRTASTTSSSTYKNSSKSGSKSSLNSSKSKSKSSSSKSSRDSSRSGSGRARSSSSSKDRKDDAKSPRKGSSSSKSSGASTKESSKSPRKSSYENNKSSPKSSTDKTSKRDSRKRSKSPILKVTTNPVEMASKDVDLRQLPLSSNIIASPINNAIISDTIADTVTVVASPIESTTAADTINSTTKCEQKFNEAGAKDIDLRVGILPTTVSTNATGPTSSPHEPKKRLSIEPSGDEPKSKKSKSDKIDILFGSDDGDQLFGTKDVDLRTMTQGIAATLNPLTPPPPPVISSAGSTPTSSDAGSINTAGWAKMKAMSPVKSSPKSPLDAVRAKLAKVTNEGRIHRNRDVDFRSHIDLFEENSQEADAKLKLIITQAQEQVETENMNDDQIQAMVQQMAKIKSDTDLRRTHKRNHQQKQSKKMVAVEKEAFSSDSGDEKLKQSHRVPSKRRRASPAPSKNADASSAQKSKDSSSGKERRIRKTKWSSPWEEPPKALHHGAGTTFNMDPIPKAFVGPDVIPAVPLAPPFMMPMGLGMGMIPPFNGMGQLPNVLAPAAAAAAPNQPFVMAQHGSSKTAYGAKERTINIDGIPREIRFYDENAIAFMTENGCEPKEIGFQSGERRICVDGKDSIVLAFNDTYKTFIIDDKPYQVRFGSPTRELYIDNEWYECYFGDPSVGIMLDGKLRVFQIDGPAPQVRIGNLRTDLVVGKVDMYVDSKSKFSLFLDAQVQTFQVNNRVHTIQFADYFLTVLIDKVPFTVQYGGMPMKFQLPATDYYIRFAVLPNDIVPGKVFVRNMMRTPLHRDLISPPPIIVADVVPTTSAAGGSHLPSALPSTSSGSFRNLPSAATTESTVPNTNVLKNLSIGDLFQKLMETGILPQQQRTTSSEDKATPTSTAAKEKEKATPVLLSRPETLKKRQSAIVHSLFSGMQCSSCGVRFPPEQTMKYSQHLDWHYRQNRRERDSARRAHSRKWYYDVSDWVQYEEIENLDEREKNWFETQQTEIDSTNDDSNQAHTSSPMPSCVAGPDDHNKACDMCHDQFETFYNEETEEWHLRNAVQVDGATYHPICYEDYKASLTMDETNLKAGDLSTADDNAVDVRIKKEKRESNGDASANEQIALDEDDDVIVVPQEEPIITEIPDDDDDPPPPSDSPSANGNETGEKKADDEQEVDTSLNNESDVQILEPQISVMDLDEIEDLPEDNVSSTTQPPQPVKIKEEPKYEGYEDDEDGDFEDVGTFESEPIGVVMNDETSVDEYVSQSVQPQQTLITTMDGNVELQDAAPTNIGTNKIKINITKNTVQLNNKNQINVSENIDNNLAINNNDKELTGGVVGGGGNSDPSRTAMQTTSTASNNNGSGGGADECKNTGPIDIEYELKESMKHAIFERKPVVHSGLETSGLCSIM